MRKKFVICSWILLSLLFCSSCSGLPDWKQKSPPSQSDRGIVTEQAETTAATVTESTPLLQIPPPEESDSEVKNEEQAAMNEAPAVSDTVAGKVLLDVVAQVQQEWNWCAPTTVSMILSCHGIHVTQAQLAREMGTEETFGTHNADAIRVLNKHLFGVEYPADGAAGYRLATVTSGAPGSEDMNLFLDRLKQDIADGYPLYLTFDVSKIYSGLSGEHNVICIGYHQTEAGEVDLIYYLDPDPGQQDPVYGAWKTVTPEELLTAMTTCVESNYGW